MRSCWRMVSWSLLSLSIGTLSGCEPAGARTASAPGAAAAAPAPAYPTIPKFESLPPPPPPPPSPWSYSENSDPMTSAVTRVALTSAVNALNLDFPYQGEQYPTLMVRAHPRYGRDVIVRLERGQIVCSSYDGCSVLVRFDEDPPKRWSANPSSDGAADVVFISNAGAFVQRLAKAKRVRLELPLYRAGGHTIEFNVEGFEAARLKAPAPTP